MAFEIIKNAEIPVNKTGGGKGRLWIYPFPQMEVGDGFDAPRDMGRTADGKACRRQSSISRAAYGYAKSHNPTAKFTVRLLDENTVRCVRIA